MNLTGYYYALCVVVCLSAFSRSHCIYMLCVVYTFSSSLVCIHIHVCGTALCFQFSLPTLYSSSLGYFGLFPGERSYIAIAAWSPAVHSTVKCVEGVTRDRRRQGSANVESNDGALSILFLFQESKKKGKNFGRPAVRLIRSNFKKKKEKKKKRPDRIVGEKLLSVTGR